VFALDL